MKQWLKKIRAGILLVVAVLALSGITAMASEDDNSLSSLGIITEGATVSPEFSYDTWSYTVTVPAGTTELQLDPVPSSSSATVTDISGTTLNEDGTGYVTITVQSGSGIPFTYELNVVSDGNAAAGEAQTEVQTEPVTETETEPQTETETETEDPQYVRVDRNSLQEAENTINDLRDEITQYRDNVNRLTVILCILIGVAVVLLFVVVNLALRRRDMKAELNDYRSYGYSEGKPSKKEQKAQQKAEKKAKKKQSKEDDFFDAPVSGQKPQQPSQGYGQGAQGAEGQIQSFYEPKQPQAPAYPGLDVQPQKSQKKAKQMPQYEAPKQPAPQQNRQGSAPSPQGKPQAGQGGKKGKQSDVEINMIDL